MQIMNLTSYHLHCRCPNADACAHDPTQLSALHPYLKGTAATKELQWDAYEQGQSNTGYQGVMCTVCVSGYGRTYGFSCEPCLGVVSGNGQVNMSAIIGIIAAYFATFTSYIYFTSLLCLHTECHITGKTHCYSNMAWWTYLEFVDVSKAFVSYLQ